MQKREVVMRKIKAVFAAIVMSVGAAGGAQAQSYDWSGFYFGGHVGYSWANSDYTLTNAVGPENFSHDPNGWMGGAHVGLQKQWSNVVAGVEVSWSATDLSDSQTAVLQPGRVRQIDIDSLFTITGRLGLTFNDWLVYAKGGYANADIDTFAINPATNVSGSTSGREHGWTIGTGLEKALTSNLILGVEYNFVRLNVSGRSGIATDATPFAYSDHDTDIHSVVARLSYKFGSERSYAPLK